MENLRAGRLVEDLGENKVKKVLEILIVETVDIAEMMCEIHNGLIELSEWIEYIHPKEMSDEYEKYAGDHLKGLSGRLMDEIQRIYPVSH